MARLSILGARRVEALQVILGHQEKSELNALDKPDDLSREQMVKDYATKKKIDVEKLVKEITVDISELKDAGFYIEYDVKRAGRIKLKDLYLDEAMAEKSKAKEKYDKTVSEIKQRYDRLKNQLWLCETLEDAKKIVGMTDEKEGN
ncbi:hypothetical protein WJM93_03915 [Lactiplantibacillus plantarum]|uniref:hypothetical protein n=1 Tax=Lactiplantibacillus plantarum TaxID=1590 RepID=UPI003098456D